MASPRRDKSVEHTILLYSDDPATRDKMRMAIGRRPAPDLGAVAFIEAETAREVVAAADAGEADLLLLDGEAWPAGGMGVSRQLKNEITDPPPMILVLARAQDRWLGTWSQADAMISHPLDPVEVARVVADQLRGRQIVTAR